jgi:hypothetical protein
MLLIVGKIRSSHIVPCGPSVHDCECQTRDLNAAAKTSGESNTGAAARESTPSAYISYPVSEIVQNNTPTPTAHLSLLNRVPSFAMFCLSSIGKFRRVCGCDTAERAPEYSSRVMLTRLCRLMQY